jgi:hypothetical protein
MSRRLFRGALTGIVLGACALAATALTVTEASAGHRHGFGHHHHHWGHWGWGARFVGFGYPAYYGGCYAKRFVDWDGTVIVKKRCF